MNRSLQQTYAALRWQNNREPAEYVNWRHLTRMRRAARRCHNCRAFGHCLSNWRGTFTQEAVRDFMSFSLFSTPKPHRLIPKQLTHHWAQPRTSNKTSTQVWPARFYLARWLLSTSDISREVNSRNTKKSKQNDGNKARRFSEFRVALSTSSVSGIGHRDPLI